MKKIIKLIVLLSSIFFAFQAGMLWDDLSYLQDNLIRMHVVANSNSQADQDLKLQVKDAIVAYLTPIVETLCDKDKALEFFNQNLDNIQKIAEDVLLQAGSEDTVHVSIGEEPFDTRIYKTFTLPSGIYQSLRIVIGRGEGENWWCVAFPSLCVPVNVQDFESVTASAGFDETLTSTITNDSEYELRFYLLDWLGKVEIFCKK